MSLASRSDGDPQLLRAAAHARGKLTVADGLDAPVGSVWSVAPMVGRHVAGSRPGLRWVLTWTLVGTALPGSGLLAAGHRRAGVVLLVAGLVTPLTVGGALWRRSTMGGGLATLDEDPGALAFGAGLTIGAGLLLAAVALVTNRALLRRSRPGRLRRATNMLVAGALVGAIVAGAWLGGAALLDRRAAAVDAAGHS
jgi:hypothetical protein